jgi:hypothetical protein
VGDLGYAPTALPPEKSRYPAGWAPGPVWTGFGEEKIFPVRTLHHVVRSESLYRLHYSGPFYFKRVTRKIHRISIRRLSGICSRPPPPHVKFVFLDRYKGFNYCRKKVSIMCWNLNFSYTARGTYSSSPSRTASRKLQYPWVIRQSNSRQRTTTMFSKISTQTLTLKRTCYPCLRIAWELSSAQRWPLWTLDISPRAKHALSGLATECCVTISNPQFFLRRCHSEQGIRRERSSGTTCALLKQW